LGFPFSEEKGVDLFIREIMKEVMKKSMGNIVKTVIVPVDFSDFSKQAFYQGVQLAGKLKADVLVVNVFAPVVVPAEGMLYMDPQLQSGAEDRFELFVDELKGGMTKTDQAKVQISAEFRIGMVTQQIQELIRETPGSMVAMSTSGAGNLTKEILGSVSLWMVKNADCPVMLVPPTHDNLQFEKILFACDHFGLNDDAVAAIKYYSGSPEAQIDIIHVFQKGSEYMDKGIEVLHESKEEQVKEVILFDPEFLDSVQSYVRSNKIDLIVMERKDRGFWRELFHISRTRKMALYSEVPLLVLHDREIKSFADTDQKEALV
jgi:nucleotide-binding universal stress UspA family protein